MRAQREPLGWLVDTTPPGVPIILISHDRLAPDGRNRECVLVMHGRVRGRGAGSWLVYPGLVGSYALGYEAPRYPVPALPLSLAERFV